MGAGAVPKSARVAHGDADDTSERHVDSAVTGITGDTTLSEDENRGPAKVGSCSTNNNLCSGPVVPKCAVGHGDKHAGLGDAVPLSRLRTNVIGRTDNVTKVVLSPSRDDCDDVCPPVE